MGGANVFDMVSVEVRVHSNAVHPERLVILRAGQRRQTEELEKVDRQFFLDDRDIALDRLRCVRWKAQNIPRDGQSALFLPGKQHLSILGDLVLALLRYR